VHNWLPGAPASSPRRWNARNAALNFEAFFLECFGQVLGRFEFLKSQLAKAKDLIDHDLATSLRCIDFPEKICLHRRRFLFIGGSREARHDKRP
jgi:hypothetical protein